MKIEYHIPVLRDESVDALAIDGKGVYVDVTFGGGGHSSKMLEKIGQGKLVAFDKDQEAKGNLIEDDRIIFVPHDFRYIKRYLRYLDVLPVKGILADLGISSHQIDSDARGFAHRFDGDLDMRMDRSSDLTAAKILNTYREERMQRLFWDYGEISNARKVVSKILKYRNTNEIKTVNELKALLEGCFSQREESKFFSKVFQALRIEVNQEMEGLKELLQYGLDSLDTGGRFVVITYHSLEDRIVKQFFNTGNLRNELVKDTYGQIIRDVEPLMRKPIVPSSEEIARNPRSRSAKLRVGVKL